MQELKLPLPKSMLEMLEDLKKELVSDALLKARGDCAEAARLLGINRTTLVQMRRRWGHPIGRWRYKNSVKEQYEAKD